MTIANAYKKRVRQDEMFEFVFFVCALVFIVAKASNTNSNATTRAYVNRIEQ